MRLILFYFIFCHNNLTWLTEDMRLNDLHDQPCCIAHARLRAGSVTRNATKQQGFPVLWSIREQWINITDLPALSTSRWPPRRTTSPGQIPDRDSHETLRFWWLWRCHPSPASVLWSLGQPPRTAAAPGAGLGQRQRGGSAQTMTATQTSCCDGPASSHHGSGIVPERLPPLGWQRRSLRGDRGPEVIYNVFVFTRAKTKRCH